MNRAPDWIVDKLELTGNPAYPYRVTGHNLNYAAGTCGHNFFWRVPDVIGNPRYCLAHTEADSATWLHVAKDARKALLKRIEAENE